uniref:CCHC-type domain-containing protein n=1 Tax=Hucho hucho TaxID=62062 RepID=A0A4W5K7I4_9TELE
MELGGTTRREAGGGTYTCTSCGRRGHTAGQCRGGSSGRRDGRQSTLASPLVSMHHSHPESSVDHLFVSVCFPDFPPHSQHRALVDSGAAGNFINRALAFRLGIPINPVAKPFPVNSLDSRPLGSGLIREATISLTMVTQGMHEEICLFLIDSPAFPVVLGLPWLALHNPILSWQQRTLTGWSRECSGRCIGVSVGATTVESPDQVPTVHIPSEYADLALAFCKKKATQLPPHRRGDCAIHFLVDAVPPRSHVYPLSQAE